MLTSFSKISLTSLILLLLNVCFFQESQGQAVQKLIQESLSDYASKHDLSAEDVLSWEITDEIFSKHNGVTHVHIRQMHAGIPVQNGVANLAIRDGEVLYLSASLEGNIAVRANASKPSLTPLQAVQAAAGALGLEKPAVLSRLTSDDPKVVRFAGGTLSVEPIPVRLMYQPGPEGELFLTWDLSIAAATGDHWWSVRMDAATGSLRDKVDWVSECRFEHHPVEPHVHTAPAAPVPAPSRMALMGGEYNVFRYTVESPIHGSRTLEIDPSDFLASPFGWHDVDGSAGAEFTITRGNNVHASEDRDNNNQPGYSPDGGAALIFDFPLNLNLPSDSFLDPAITNLFYYNNIMHDVWYRYGFDEQAGNFQENNYNRGGAGGDYVNADAQDGSGTNNANFGTPPDGSNPRMQMYLWAGGAVDLVNVHTPPSIAGFYGATEAGFGPGVPQTPLTADAAIASDGTGNTADICDPIQNGTELSGKIVVVDRGTCTYVSKVLAAQNEGALAVIIVNNIPGPPVGMGGNSNLINIPTVMISQADGALIKARITAGDSVSITLQDLPGTFNDSDFDNGIIAHEYGHGISNRLTGGPSNTSCLGNAEQMGEGWSDYMTMMMSFDTAFIDRGVGTYVQNQAITGGGIRPARYSDDFAVNNFTYATTNNAGQTSQPHGIGFVWCSMLYDMTLLLVDQYGYDPDIYNGNGGNNIAMQLVIDGMKLQPCGPGFVDGRDAILAADMINNGGANECLIWEAFARRGLGFSADQGSSASRTDQTEAFDLPNICLIPTVPPAAAYSFVGDGACGDRVVFTDASTDIPQAYFWDFGDGATDTIANPTHLYTASGTYTVTLIVSNTEGSDTLTQQVTITLPVGPMASDTVVCVGGTALLSVSDSGQFNWFDANGALLANGPDYQTPAISADETFFVQKLIPGDSLHIGPSDGSFASGGYHNSGFTGTLNFTAFSEFAIVSAWIDAGSSGSRTINLWDAQDGGGTVIDQVTINVPTGPQRVTLNLQVPGPGTYSVGGSGIDLFRNNTGANYPYTIPNVLNIFSSSATTGPQNFYYYLYDWEVQTPDCITDRTPVEVKAADAAFSFTQDSTNVVAIFTDQSAAATDWFWSFGDGNTSTLQNPIHGYASQGDFVVSLTINGACTITDTVSVSYRTGIGQLASGVSVQLLPNPARDLIWVNLSTSLSTDVKVSLYTIEGRLIERQTLEQGETRQAWSIDQLAPGVYMMRLLSDLGEETIRFVKTP